MKKKIQQFLAKIRQLRFDNRIRREIFKKISPNLRGQADYIYPFSSDEELVQSNTHACLTTKSILCQIDRMAGKMPKPEGDAFRHIVNRDLQEWIWPYFKFAQERTRLDASKMLSAARLQDASERQKSTRQEVSAEAIGLHVVGEGQPQWVLPIAET